MQPNALVIENMPDVMVFLQEMETQDVEIFGGFRPLARRATAEIIERVMEDNVDKHLDAIDQTCEAPRRRRVPVLLAVTRCRLQALPLAQERLAPSLSHFALDHKTLNPGHPPQYQPKPAAASARIPNLSRNIRKIPQCG